jgi:choline-sulfatase
MVRGLSTSAFFKRLNSLVLPCVSAIACAAHPQPAALPAARDLVLVTIDTLRADHVGATGGPAGITPTIDALARAGVVFRDATAHAPLTLPSHATILTGRYPPAHGVADNSGFTLGDSIPTLATILHGAGFQTAAFVSSYVLRGSTGLARGFDSYDDRFAGAGQLHVTVSSLERRGPEVAREAARWLRGARRPYFLWVHLYDPHAPYDPPPAFAAKFPGRPYDGEIATSDFAVSTLLDALDPGRRAETLIVVTGDHGESLGEHGESEHGILLYDATLHVPLVIAGPRVPGGVTVASQVRHVDVVPTVLDLLGVAVPTGLDGVTLRPAMTRTDRAAVGPPEAPLSYAESRFGALHFGWSAIHSARDGVWKYIEAPRPELYDLRSDPSERTNAIASRSQTAEGLARALASTAQGSAPPTAPATTADAAERLRSLGYVGGRVALGGTEGADPKDEIGRYEAYVRAFNDALQDLESGRAALAEARFRALAQAFPRAFEAHQYLARALAARRAWRPAVAELDLAIRLSPREAVLYFDAARTLADAAQFTEAFARLEAGRRLEPSSFYGALTEGLVARAAGRLDRAERAFREAVALNPSLALAHFELGAFAERRGDRPAAEAEYRAALDGDPTMTQAREALDRLRRQGS